MSLRRLFAALLLVPLLPLSGRAQVEASLVAADQSIQPGATITVALHLVHEEGWHTYWINPGIGLPTTIQWDLPPGWTAGDIQWPAPGPIRDSTGAITGNGYDGDLLLPVVLTAPAEAASGGDVTLKAHVDWLMCADVCIPGNADLTLTLPILSTAPIADPQWGGRIRDTLAALPRPDAAWNVTAMRSAKNILLEVTPANGPGSVAGLGIRARGLRFFSENTLVDFAQPQTAQSDGAGGFTIRMPLTKDEPVDTARLTGFLTTAESWAANGKLPGLKVDVPFAQVFAGSAPFDADPVSQGLVGILLLAFLGGLILNLMPCVFPVLGIKILGFVNQAGHSRSRVIAHGLTFTGGVLLSFWVLAAVLAAFRSEGARLGWGFQLQSPAFVFALAIVMLIFALNLSGVFEFGLRATSLAGGLNRQSGLTGTFFAGVLATVVATPCSAPFLAPALGAALALPTAPSFAVFTVVALGLSTPYLALSAFPQALRFLPRPGAWMETFRQLMAFPLYATVVYLVWVLAGQLSAGAQLAAGFGLVLIALGVWCYGRWNRIEASPPRRRFGIVAGVILLLAGSSMGWPRTPAADEVVWQDWSPQAVAALRAEGRIIYVDFTARWCATCQANKKLVFGSDAVRKAFAEQNVAALEADWTNRDPLITAELARYNRSAVPFTQIWLPGHDDPVILPELLTPGIVLDALQP